jgi:hypothetical protein
MVLFLGWVTDGVWALLTEQIRTERAMIESKRSKDVIFTISLRESGEAEHNKYLSKLLHNIAKRGMMHHVAEEAFDHGSDSTRR